MLGSQLSGMKELNQKIETVELQVDNEEEVLDSVVKEEGVLSWFSTVLLSPLATNSGLNTDLIMLQFEVLLAAHRLTAHSEHVKHFVENKFDGSLKYFLMTAPRMEQTQVIIEEAILVLLNITLHQNDETFLKY
jgi:hypothetical protein